MSKITAVYSGILTALGALLPDKTRIPYAYSLKDNIDRFLVNGFGIKVEGAGPSELIESCSYSMDRIFSIPLTREYIAIESDTEIQDDVALLLMEDSATVTAMFANPERMGINEISIVNISGDDGITEVIVGKRKFLSIELRFQITINESY